MALQTKDFSVSGKSSGGGITYTYILRVTENSVNVLQNTSNLTVQAILKQTYSGQAFHTWGTGVSCTLNGNQIFSDYQQRELTGTAEKVYYTWTGNVAHDSDGNLRLKVGGKLWQNSSASYTPPTLTITESDSTAMVLTYIPRASTMGASDADIGSVCAISVNRKNNDFSHTISWKFGALSGYIGGDWQISDTPAKLMDTSIAFVIPENFYAQIPNAKSGVCYLTITTYSGDTQVGDPQSAQFNAKANETLCAPDVTGTVADINPVTLALTGNSKHLVKFFSTARCSMTATAKKSASIAQRRIGGTEVEGNSLDIPNAELTDVTFTAVDSRGFPGTDTDEDLILIPYIRLTNKATCKRTDPTSGKATLAFEGDWFSGSFGAVSNALTLTYSINGGAEKTVKAVTNGNKYTASVALEGLAYQQNHTITVAVRDKLDEAVRVLTLGKGIPVFDWGENDFRFHVPVTMPQLVMDDCTVIAYGYRGICADADMSLDPGGYLLDANSVNAPNTDGILLVFCAGEQENAAVWQIAVNRSCTARKCRMIWDGSIPTGWVDL